AMLIGWLSTAAAAAGAPQAVARADLDSGAISGRIEDGINVFLGIPYAAPPTGELRWVPPRAPARWPGTRAATAFGSACPQTGPLEAEAAEDCLTLNVWAPAAAGADKRPVMVWIHGGGFNFGASSQPEYRGATLAREGVVVVTLNYRLGPLGFFPHRSLTGIPGPGASGDFGLLDQIEALKWVRRNIAAFGGNPDNVTLFGQSAGSRSVSLLTLSPLADGLFHRAIAESGGPIIGSEYLTPAFDGDPAAVAAMSDRLAARLGCDGAADVLSCLRTKTAMAVVKAADCKTGLFDDGLFFAPVFDGNVLPRDPVTALRDERRPRVPMIVGSTGDEGTTYLRGVSGLNLQTYESFLVARFGAAADRARAMFPVVGGGDVYRAIDRFITVAVNAEPARFMARAAERAGGKAYLYRFTRRPNTARARELGAFHGVELAYVFGNMKDSDGYTQLDHALSQQVSAYWANFARSGDPNGQGLPEWPVYRAATDETLQFDDTVRRESGLYRAESDFIDRVSRFGLTR
ncbi:MAG: carboxylesterase family protein, partial [Ancalomicrobiaceae bacterium]|nr:carboxylesterase family protein [Ancalomicrobiaceae bacterium]